MQTLFITISILGVSGLFALIHAAFTAPEALEDERGFRFVNPSEVKPVLYPVHATLSEGAAIFFK